MNDCCELMDISSFTYKEFVELMREVSNNMWSNALEAIEVAEKNNINTTWYANLKQAISTQEKYQKGYWLQYYLYKDLEYQFSRNKDKKALRKLNKAYYSGDWNSML